MKYVIKHFYNHGLLINDKETNNWTWTRSIAVATKFNSQKEANEIINSIKICDPAVGSGHFLVSALNEIMAIKSRLKVLLSRDGKTLRD